MNGCGKYEDLLARYLHGQVLLQEVEDLEGHLAMCAACEKLYREIADIDRILREMPDKSVEPPSHLRSKIVANLREEEGSPAWRPWGKWAAAIGAAAACILAGVVLYRGAVPKESRVAPLPSAATPAAQSPQATAPKDTAKAPTEKLLIVREVKIYFYHPAASKVAVTGDFNGWNPEGVLLTASGEPGVWKTTLRLRPGAYSYNFIVDGNLLVPDPNAPDQMPDGYGGTNSILLVKGGNSV